MPSDKPLRPFKNESDSRQIGELTIENRTNRIEMYGSLSITRDKAGLAAALTLKQIIDGAVELLKSEKLPDQIVEASAKTVSNPFAAKG